MKAAINTLGHVLYAPSQYVIPVFQRNYRWERPQWEKLWASVVEIQQPEKTGNHFMGFLVFVQGGVAQPGQNTRFHLIDGQQRLTTTSLLLAAIRNVARRHGHDELAEEVHQYYLVHPLKKGEHHVRLLPKAQDHDAFVAIVHGRAPPLGRMADALAYFEAQLNATAAQDDESLRRIFDLVCQRLEFMCATLESENAYSIFKSLNSTGVPLGQADLIRNFVFMHVHPDQQDEFDCAHWAPLEELFADEHGRLDEARFSRFFRDVLMAEGEQYVQPADTFGTFEARNEATGFDPVALAKRLRRHAGLYAVISGLADDESSTITNVLIELNRLESSTTYPLLLSLFAARESGRLQSDDVAHCVDMLRGFIFRRFVCGESSRGYGQMFVRAIDSEAGDILAALDKYLRARGWPHDERFIDAFMRLPLYKRGYAREVLEALEQSRGHKEPASLALAQVEHVMPQTLSPAWIEDLGDEPERVHAEWLHTPGNLTLSAYNQEVGNQPFAVKRARFASSNVGLTREIADSPQWTESEIQGRGLRMAQDAVGLWTGPSQPQESEALAVQVQQTRGVRLAFWTAFAEYMRATHPDVPTIEPVQKRTIRLKTSAPHTSLDLRYKVQEDAVALDLYFNRKITAIWDQLRHDKDLTASLVGQGWEFGEAPRGAYAWMTIERFASSADAAHWPTLHGWLGQKLAQLYELLLPHVRNQEQELLPVLAGGTADENADGPTATKLQQQRFWAVLADAIRERSATLRPQKPLPQHWTNYAIGRSGITIMPTVNSRDDRIGVELSIGTHNAKEQFKALMTQRDIIESTLGFPVEWQELPDRISSRVACSRTESPPADESRWHEYVEWMVDRILKFEDAFRVPVRTLP